MKTMLHMLAVKEKDRCANPWVIRSAADDYHKILAQYKETPESKLLLVWNVMSGVRIVRADLDDFKMHEDFSNIQMPFDNLAGHWRAALYMPVYCVIEEAIKNDDGKF